MKQGQVSGGKS
jgi:hypothetical protein